VKVTGYTSQDYEANPQLWYDMIYADDRATVQGQTAWLVADEDAAPIEHRLIHQDGSIRWVRNTAVLQYDPSGRFVGYSGLIEDITERKQMEEMLRESEEKYRTLIEQSDDAIYLIYGGKFVVINRRFQELFGVSPEDIIEPDFVFTNIVSPKSRKLVSAWTSEGQGKKVSPRYEFAAINRKGDEIDVELTVSYPNYKDGLATQGVLRDITRRKKIEREREVLLSKEREQRILAETLGEIFLAISAQTSREAVLDEILRQVQRVVSYSAASMVWLEGETLHTVRCQGYQSYGSEQFLTNLRQPLDDFPVDAWVVRSRKPLVVADTQHAEEWVTMEESSWIRSTVSVPIHLQDKVLGLLRLDSEVPNKYSVQDVDRLQPLANAAAIALENARLYDQARQELDERRQTERDLRQMTARNQAILDAMPDSLLYLNRKGEILDYKAVDDIFWPEILNDLGDNHNLGAVLPPDFVEQIVANGEKALRSETVQLFEYQVASTFGTQEFEVRLVASGDNEVLVIIRNITERKRAEQQAIRIERLAALGQLAATLAHEINNPLQAMQSHLDLILDNPLGPGETEAYLQVIRHEIERLNQISQRALNFANPKAAPPRPVSVVKLVQEVLTLAGKQLEYSHIHVSTEFQPVPSVFAVPDQLSQVFLNLVINALEASSGSDGRLHVAVQPEGDYIAIAFSNGGPKIPSAHLARIFEPFFTTKIEGSGLGLWVSHTLVQQQGGSLTVENRTDAQGVTFTVKLPVTE
jgi:two-component system NtrC family sensor kinase